MAWGSGRVQEKEGRLELSGGVAWRRGGEVRTEGGARGRARGGVSGEGRENRAQFQGWWQSLPAVLKSCSPFCFLKVSANGACLEEGGGLVWTGRIAEGAWEGCCPALYSSGLKYLSRVRPVGCTVFPLLVPPCLLSLPPFLSSRGYILFWMGSVNQRQTLCPPLPVCPPLGNSNLGTPLDFLSLPGSQGPLEHDSRFYNLNSS